MHYIGQLIIIMSFMGPVLEGYSSPVPFPGDALYSIGIYTKTGCMREFFFFNSCAGPAPYIVHVGGNAVW